MSVKINKNYLKNFIEEYKKEIQRLKKQQETQTENTDSQKEKISNSVGATSAYTVHELLSKVYDKDVQPYETIKGKDGKSLGGDFNINHEATLTGTVFDNNKRIKILVVDEIGKINIADLKALCEYAHENNIFILGLGDLLQITPITHVAGDESSTQDFTACIEDCIFTKAPELTASLRIQNLAKLDNYNTFRAVMSDMHSMQHRNVQIGHLSKAVTRQIDLYYDEDDKGFYGEKIEKDRAALLDTMTKVMAKDPDKTYAIITDDTEDTAFTQLAAKHPNIQIVPYESMQGGEWDYAFVDVDFGKIEEKCNKVKSLYTLSQRSRIGTVFVDHGISKALSVNPSLYPPLRISLGFTAVCLTYLSNACASTSVFAANALASSSAF